MVLIGILSTIIDTGTLPGLGKKFIALFLPRGSEVFPPAPNMPENIYYQSMTYNIPLEKIFRALLELR